MTAGGRSIGDTAKRARSWRDASHASVCDVVEPWAHGTVVRATSHPSYFDFNVVRVERANAMSVRDLTAFADEALAGLEHRKLDFDLVEPADELRAEFEALGWRATRLSWMRHEAPLPEGPEIVVETVPYDAVLELRVAWHHEDFPGQDPAEYHAQAREVALRRGAQLLAVTEGDKPVAYAQIERNHLGAEITDVYVHPEHRGTGRGTAITRAATAAAGDADDLWIVADDEDRPKDLYARLGFRPAWTTMEFLLLPPQRRA